MLRDRGAEVLFVGAMGRGDARLVESAGYEIRYLKVSALSRSNPFKALAAVGRAVLAVPHARKLLREWGADAAIGAGGYVAAPVGVAAATLGVPLILTEADTHLGVTNRLLARWAKRICLAFPIAGYDDDRYIVTGRPVRATATPEEAAKMRAKYGFTAADTVLVAVGGSQGARSINRATLAAFASSDRSIKVLHVAGRRDFAELQAELESKGRPAHYRLVDFIDDFDKTLAVADLVVARAGASLFELAAAGKPSILVPYPYATGQHQRRNAQWMAAAGAAVVIEDEELDASRLRAEVERLLNDRVQLAAMAAAARRVAKPDAAERVALSTLAAAGTLQSNG